MDFFLSLLSQVLLVGLGLAILLYFGHTKIRLWHALLGIPLTLSAIFAVVIVGVRWWTNRGIDGAWGAHGIWAEIWNMPLLIASLGFGYGILLCLFVLALCFADWSSSGRR